MGETYPVEHYEDAEGKHCQVVLSHDDGTWYIWKPHWDLPDVDDQDMENKKGEVNAWFLVRAALAYADDNAPQNQTQMLLYIWEVLSQEERQKALDLFEGKADRRRRLMELLEPESGSQESPKNDKSSSGSIIPKAGLTLIKEFEGYHEKLSNGSARAYKDPLHGWKVPTIGYGTTRYRDGKKVRKGDVISPNKAEECLRFYVDSVCRPHLEKIPTWGQMNENQRASLYSFAYNLGPGFYRGKNFNSITNVCDSPHRWGDEDWVTAQFVKYRNPGSAAEAGLRRRRLREAKLFCTPVNSNQTVKAPQLPQSSSSIPTIQTSEPENTFKVVAKSNTILKAEPEGSQYLRQSEKVMIAKGEELACKSYSPSSGQHLALKLVRPILAEDDETKLINVYAYEPHVEVQGKVDGKDVQRVIKLNVPYFYQVDNDTTYHRSGYRQCNLTCNAMLADYLLEGELSRLAKSQGFKEPESIYGKTLKKYGDTIYHDAQTKALQAYGIDSYYSGSLSRDEWLQSLELGIPVVFGVKYKSSGHICLLVGHDPVKRMWIVHDPYGTRHGSRDVYDVGVGGAFDLYSYGTMDVVADGRGRIVTAVKGKPTGLPKGL